METGYFYSKSTGLWVARGPLKIDARIIKAAQEIGIALHWDDEGRINHIRFTEATLLLEQLGATLMTLTDYWRVRKDAMEVGDDAMVSELQSDRYAEWLNTIFEKKEYAIERVTVRRDGTTYCWNGTRKSLVMPYGHPGWFNAEEVDFETGLPRAVELNRERRAVSWKYWSFCDYEYVAAAIRGWVTSVGKPSLDLGIPIDASCPLLLLRECRTELLEPAIKPQILERAEKFIADFESQSRSGNYEAYYAQRGAFIKFAAEYGKLFRHSQDMRIYKIREKLCEIFGMLRVKARRDGNDSSEDEIASIAREVFELSGEKSRDKDFTAFIVGSPKRLREAVRSGRPIVFVTGHKNPDTDSVVSAIAEAWRNHLIDGETRAYIPIVQGSRMPDEIARLLGERLTKAMLFTVDPFYAEVAKSGQARWIMVDHNLHPEIQKFVVSIVDHHIPSVVALRQEVAKTIEVVGSTSSLIAQRLYGLGLNIQKGLACILYGGTLMDTENRSKLKMTAKDILIMDDLKELSGIVSDAVFYEALMSELLNTNDAERLFERDYKEDWLFFGFAVAKLKGVFDRRGNVRKTDLLERLVLLAHQNNERKNLPLTLIKIVNYEEDNQTVERERVYLVFNEAACLEFRETMFKLFEAIIRRTFGEKTSLRKTESFIEFWGVGDQLSRKRIVPLLEPVAVAFNRYFYSPSTGLYVKREFLKYTKQVRQAAEACDLDLSWDEQGRINYITYGESVRLLERFGCAPPSLNEYWHILRDARAIHDQQMVSHLQSSGFVEFLHTVIEEGGYIIEKPHIVAQPSSYIYEDVEVMINYTHEGERRGVEIPEGKPGLVSPDDINFGTGLPVVVYPPNIYDDPTLWRYWSPDAQKNVATRGFIFLLGQPALDLKVHLSEAFQCLGVRPCCRTVELPKVEIIEGEQEISLVITEEGETLRVREYNVFVDEDGWSDTA